MASIARRPFLISDTAYLSFFLGSLPRFKGSKEKSPEARPDPFAWSKMAAPLVSSSMPHRSSSTLRFSKNNCSRGLAFRWHLEISYRLKVCSHRNSCEAYVIDPLATDASWATKEFLIDSYPLPGIRAPESTATHPNTASIEIRPCFNSASLIHSTVVIGVLSDASNQLSGTICWLQSFWNDEKQRRCGNLIIIVLDSETKFAVNQTKTWKRTSDHWEVKPRGSNPTSPGSLPVQE